MNRAARLVVLYLILGTCITNIVTALVTGTQPPDAIYGVLGTIGGYILLKEGKARGDQDRDGEE